MVFYRCYHVWKRKPKGEEDVLLTDDGYLKIARPLKVTETLRLTYPDIPLNELKWKFIEVLEE